jgi:hypothetical protein
MLRFGLGRSAVLRLLAGGYCMKSLTILAALLVSQAAVTVATASPGCQGDKIKMTCAEGTTWDDDSRTCMPKPSA